MGKINVLELAKGAIIEQIDNEMGKVLANLLDPNTDTKTKRKLTVNLIFEVDEDREIVKCTAQAASILAKIKPVTTVLALDIDNHGRPVAAELNRDQGSALAGEIDKELKLVRSV